MADYGTLGQSNPAATTNTTLFTASFDSIASTLIVCNQGVAATYRVAIRPAGATLAAQHYIIYDQPINPAGVEGSSHFYTSGLSFNATDVVTVYASTATLSFTLSGVESP